MLARAFAVCLVVAAALADASGSHGAAFYFLLAAAPAVGVAALAALGDLVEAQESGESGLERMQVFLSVAALVFVLAAAAFRSDALFESDVPAFSIVAMAGCLAALAGQGALAFIVGQSRRTAGVRLRAGEDFASSEHAGRG